MNQNAASESRELGNMLVLLAARYKQAATLYEMCNLRMASVHSDQAPRQSRCDRYMIPTELIFILEEIPEYSGQREVKESTQSYIMYNFKFKFESNNELLALFICI